jgi:hypothetical protein
MLDMQREMLEAIGIRTGKLTPIEVYELAGKAIQDHELTMLAQASGRRVQAINAMSPAERLSLRERVTGVVRFKA